MPEYLRALKDCSSSIHTVPMLKVKQLQATTGRTKILTNVLPCGAL